MVGVRVPPGPDPEVTSGWSTISQRADRTQPYSAALPWWPEPALNCGSTGQRAAPSFLDMESVPDRCLGVSSLAASPLRRDAAPRWVRSVNGWSTDDGGYCASHLHHEPIPSHGTERHSQAHCFCCSGLRPAGMVRPYQAKVGGSRPSAPTGNAKTKASKASHRGRPPGRLVRGSRGLRWSPVELIGRRA